MMTVGDAATADVSIEIRSDEHSQLIFSDGSAANDDSQRGYIIYDHTDENFKFGVNALEFMRAHSIGAITKPLQPAFLANPAVAGSSPVQTNISSGDTITFGNEVFDQNNDFASNTFTAPVTGKYQFNVGLFLEQVDTDYTELRIKLVTSNRNYDHFDIGSPFPSDRNLQYHLSALADMDASDTAVLQVTFGSGGAQMDVNALTYFSGYLVC
jgi:hypothetical protein